MMAATKVSIELAGEAVEEVWCPGCLLGTMVAQVVLITVGPKTLVGIGQVCRECGRQEPVR